MIVLEHQVPLESLNTFHIPAQAAHFFSLQDLSQLPELSRIPEKKRVLGGGSNILLTGDVEGLLIHNQLKGIRRLGEDDDFVWLEVAAGEQWHGFVVQTIEWGLGGVENLALIPGSVGAAPIQNIGAYGVEVKDVIHSVTAWHWDAGTYLTFANADCAFDYRESVFKRTWKDQLLITSVTFRLAKRPEVKTSYGDIQQYLRQCGVDQPDPRAVAEAVIHIRRQKLPDPANIGNAGSFFKNPTISLDAFEALKKELGSMPGYNIGPNMVKIPAAWLIEQSGWKGYRKGDAGVHDRQALVLVNYGQATGWELATLAARIEQSVQERYNIALEREVNIW